MIRKKTVLAKMGTKHFKRIKKKKNTLTQKQRYAERKKAMEEFKSWYS